VGLLWLGRKNTVLDQLCGRRPDYQRLTPRLWHSRKSRSSAGPMLSRLKPSNNLPQIGDIVAVDVDRHDLPAVLLAPASGTWCLYPWVCWNMFPKYPMGRQTLAARHVGSRKLPHAPTSRGANTNRRQFRGSEDRGVRASRRAGRTRPGAARRRAGSMPADKVPANPLRRFKKALRSENVAKFGRRRGRVGGQPQKNFMPPGPLEYTGCLGSTGQPSAPIAVE